MEWLWSNSSQFKVCRRKRARPYSTSVLRIQGAEFDLVGLEVLQLSKIIFLLARALREGKVSFDIAVMLIRIIDGDAPLRVSVVIAKSDIKALNDSCWVGLVFDEKAFSVREGLQLRRVVTIVEGFEVWIPSYKRRSCAPFKMLPNGFEFSCVGFGLRVVVQLKPLGLRRSFASEALKRFGLQRGG